MTPSPRTIAVVRAAGLAGWVACALIAWVAAPPLGHDEARYAISAQDILDGAPARWLYQSVGMNAVALPGVLAGGGELALRALPTAIGLAFLLAAARLARGVFGAATAAWAVAVLAGSFSFVRRASELLSDLPAAACLLAGTAIVAAELARSPAPGRRLVLAAPCLAAAFYLRYGSILAIAAIGGAALVVGWPALRRRPGPALAAVALLALLFVPHLLAARAATGDALGILRLSSAVLDAGYSGHAITTYVTVNPFVFYGIVTVPVMLAGLAAIRRGRDPCVRFLWLTAVGHIALVGWTPVPQARYIYFGVTLLLILGTDEILRWLAARPAGPRRALGGLAAAMVAASWLTVAIGMLRLEDTRRAGMAGMLDAVAAIRADAGDAPCEVIGRASAQLQWYTGCVALYVTDPETLAHRRVYLVREPDEELQPELTGRPGVPRTLLERPHVVVLRYDPS